MTSIFLMATTKVFLKLPPKFFLWFFQTQIDFRTQANIFEKKNLHAKFNFLCVELIPAYTNIGFFFPFLFITFFKNAEKFSFLNDMFLYALVNVW